MTTPSQRPVATFLALVLTAAFWIPTVASPVSAQALPREPIVLTTAAPLVMM